MGYSQKILASMNKNIPISPFLEQRKEKDYGNCKVYINYKEYPNWASINNYLITGSRGTGKSSVLTSFDYRTRWFKSHLVSYCEEYEGYKAKNICDTQIIGILFKADRVESGLWDKWYNNSHENGTILFATYISYYFASKILVSLKEILASYFATSFDELLKTSLIERLFYLCEPRWRRKYSSLYDFSIDGLISFFDEQETLIREFLYMKCSGQWPQMIPLHSSSSGFIDEFCKIICEEIGVFSEKLFFLMIDDVDRLKDWQIKIINSFIKVSTTPCAWKLSSSLPYQTFATEDDVKISGTDLKISCLNDEDTVGVEQQKDRIDELFDAIFRSRLQSLNLKVIPSVKNLFGKMDLEKALKDVVDKSLNPILKSEYRGFINSGKKYFTDYWLIEKGIIKENEQPKKFDKYRVNATFAIVKKYNLQDTFQYYSYDIIRALCSGSPRHFLRICDSMWPAIFEAINNGNIKINKDEQNFAIRKASEELEIVIGTDRISRGIEVSCYKMYQRLGELFVLLTNNETSLKRSQECMSVKFNVDDVRPELNRRPFLKILDKLLMLEVIKIRVDESAPSIYHLGLNPMITPNFCISFRNPFLNTLSVDANLLFYYLTRKEDLSPEILCEERIGNSDPKLFNDNDYE